MAVTYVHQALRAPADPSRDAWSSRLAAAGAALCVISVVMAAAGAPADEAVGRGLVELLVVGVPITAGLYALRAPPTRRFGVTLLIIGVAWSLTALGEASLSVPYTIGRVANWLVLPGVFYLLLVFPDGRVDGLLDRALLLATAAVALVLFFGLAPFVEAFPLHTPWATCVTDCPANAIHVVDHQPAFVAKAVLLREWAVGAIWVGMGLSMLRRWRAASPLQRWAMGPVFVVAALMGALQIAFYTARELGAPPRTVETLGAAWALCIVGLTSAFLFGLFWRRLLMAGALARLGTALRYSAGPAQVRDALAATLTDPTLELLFRDDASGAWRDARGHTVRWPPKPPAGRGVTVFGGDDDTPAVAMVHDLALRDDEELLSSVSGLVVTGWRHERLLSDLRRAMHDLEDSRRRIAEAADVERVRIERDLHDGAQQRLIALGIRLSLTEELVRSDPEAGATTLHELGFEVEHAIEELRLLAHGVYPSLLTDWGLEHALRGAARNAPKPVHLVAVDITRHPIELESAVYFVCLEALQNAMKHAPTASGVWIRLRQSRTLLRFEVRDDGSGFEPERHPHGGLRNMRDRMDTVGGELTISSSPGAGTRVAGSVALS